MPGWHDGTISQQSAASLEAVIFLRLGGFVTSLQEEKTDLQNIE
jgi:hypothetical protein